MLMKDLTLLQMEKRNLQIMMELHTNRTVIFRFAVPLDGFVHKESLYAEDEMTFADKEGIMPMPKVTNISFENEFQVAFPTTNPKYCSKRKSKDIHSESEKEANKPPSTWFDVKVNTHVYVTRLPEDVM
ncbi:hypothetical protein SUGI_1056650 [Cryptomeria japonica]|nr:hypothetical protein SUGI_1056650 [Cryptomeria japonica]